MHKRIVYWQVICDGCGKETRVDAQKFFPPSDWAGDIYHNHYSTYDSGKDYCPACVLKKEVRETFK